MRYIVIGRSIFTNEQHVLFTYLGTEADALARAEKDNIEFGSEYHSIYALRLAD